MYLNTKITKLLDT